LIFFFFYQYFYTQQSHQPREKGKDDCNKPAKAYAHSDDKSIYSKG
jgi:hypothetical protein